MPKIKENAFWKWLARKKDSLGLCKNDYLDRAQKVLFSNPV